MNSDHPRRKCKGESDLRNTFCKASSRAMRKGDPFGTGAAHHFVAVEAKWRALLEALVYLFLQHAQAFADEQSEAAQQANEDTHALPSPLVPGSVRRSPRACASVQHCGEPAVQPASAPRFFTSGAQFLRARRSIHSHEADPTGRRLQRSVKVRTQTRTPHAGQWKTGGGTALMCVVCGCCFC